MRRSSSSALVMTLALVGCDTVLGLDPRTLAVNPEAGIDGAVPIVDSGFARGPEGGATGGSEAATDGGATEAATDGGAPEAAADGGGTGVVDADAGPATCIIDGAVFPNGASNPTNACELCLPAASATAWSNTAPQTSCRGDAGTCSSGTCITAKPNCRTGSDGVTNCGAALESCCTTLPVEGGTFDRTDSDGGLADPATVSSFRLDKYLVTVGRFREWVSAYNGGKGWTPQAGSGKHTHLNGGAGLTNAADGGYETGWVVSDDANLDVADVDLLGCHGLSTWTSTPGANETLPIECINWYDAYAFCIWDGGFLPSEAEWLYAAAGGSRELTYPWGSTDPGAGNQYAIYYCYYPNPLDNGTCTGVVNIAPVGTATLGAARWGQLDMAGELWEWTLDSFASTFSNPCADCAYLTSSKNRVYRGTLWDVSIESLGNFNAESRGKQLASDGFYEGFRCARP